MFTNNLAAQINYNGIYQIKNNSNLAVCIDFTVVCDGGKTTTEAKLITIPAGVTYTLPAPFLNCAIYGSGFDVDIQIAGLFGSQVVNSKNLSSRYNEGMGWFNTQNNLKPQGVIIWGPVVTNIW